MRNWNLIDAACCQLSGGGRKSLLVVADGAACATDVLLDYRVKPDNDAPERPQHTTAVALRPRRTPVGVVVSRYAGRINDWIPASAGMTVWGGMTTATAV
ncbi:hypothetical protein [Candidatus Spongiihabitans sp.]|uniref:hypothetical protein n=1 Tax=Candidatus Spongiihabitans sp. TaxID=3101308 RepID=UPI003C7E0221